MHMTINTQDRRYPEFTVGWRLRLARTQLGPGMDAAKFADLIGVSRNTVANYELERVAPRKLVLNAWALATGVDVDWLRTGIRPQEPGTPGGGRTFVLDEAPGSGVCSVSTRIRHTIPATRGRIAA